MQRSNTITSLYNIFEVRQAKERSIARQYRTGGTDSIERPVDLSLDTQALGHRLTHQIRIQGSLGEICYQ